MAIAPKKKAHKRPPILDRTQKLISSPKKFKVKGKPQAINQMKI